MDKMDIIENCCAGCLKPIPGRTYLTCSTCTEKYDLDCANVSFQRYRNTMTADHKKAWICDTCYCKKPKTGNLNTPLRPEKTTSPSKQNSALNQGENSKNVTRRTKPSQPVCITVHSDEETIPSEKDSTASTPNTWISGMEILLRKSLEEMKQELKEEFKKALTNMSQEQGKIKEELFAVISELRTENLKLRSEIKYMIEEGNKSVISLGTQPAAPPPSTNSRRGKAVKANMKETASPGKHVGPAPATAPLVLPAPSAPSASVSQATSTTLGPAGSSAVSEPLVTSAPFAYPAPPAPRAPLAISAPLAQSEPASPPVPSYATAVAEGSNGQGQKQESEWKEVKSKIKRNPINRGQNSMAILKAVERKKYLHVWRLKKDITEENMTEFIKEVIGSDSDIEVTKLKPKIDRSYASFKVGVSERKFEQLINPEKWPLDVEYSEWTWFRPSTFRNQEQHAPRS
ncbi:hypothetical protein JYU34_003678 [Plutella xylostella]|uniref:PHD-type domain-containing protein n=1 Tax=Plutella xylostella TaxID=51655 RepID=A0ABQ7R0M1_PLUXY|nr:hypothetical protein JYU34_003678 [Plutella xylostella]